MFENTLEKIINLDEVLSVSYEGHKDKLNQLITEVEEILISNFGIVPPWEMDHLNAARSHINSNWLKAALSEIHNSIVVSSYNDEEYWGGYNYNEKNPKIGVRRK